MTCVPFVYVVDCYIAREQHVLIRSLLTFFVCVIVAACKVYYRYIRKKRKENCKSTAKHNVYDEDYHKVCESQTHLSKKYEHSKEVINKLRAENDDLRKQLKEKDSHIARMTRRLSSKRTELARLNQVNERKDSEIERLKQTLSQSMEESSSLRQANGRKDGEIKMHEGTAKIQGLELQQLQEQLATREEEVTSLNNELSAKQTELQEVREKLTAYQEELTTLADQMIHKEQELEHCQEILATVQEQVYQGLDELFISHDEALSQLEEVVYLNFLLNHSSLSTFSCAGVIHISYSIDE